MKWPHIKWPYIQWPYIKWFRIERSRIKWFRSIKWPQKIGLILFCLFVLIAVFGPMAAPFSPFSIDGEPLSPPSSLNWFGTNSLGQDLFSQFVYGARTSLFVGLAVSLISTTLSALFGLLAGYSRKMDTVLDSIANMLLVLPSLLLILIVASFTGGGTWQFVLTLGLISWPGYMKLIRASVLSLKEREFVKAAQMVNGGTYYILRKHLLPFLWPLIRTKWVMSFYFAVAMEASLSFLGIADPNVPSWGKMLRDAFTDNQTLMTDAWQWTIVPPTLAIVLVTVALALLGETRQEMASRTMVSRTMASRKMFSRAALLREKKGRIQPIAVFPPGTAPSDECAAPSTRVTAPSIGMPSIFVKGLNVVYGKQQVLHDITFEVASGSITAVIGESGSGKTTLARALYGLLPEGSVDGEVIVAGKKIWQRNSHVAGKRNGQDEMMRWLDAAYIFQDPRDSFNPVVRIGDQFFEAMHSFPSLAEKRQAAEKALREVQLDGDILNRFPHELSGGMLSRTLIALALINKPKVLIADEPTGALDAIVKREVLDLLVRKVREHQMTLLMITHDIPAAIHMADKVLLLEKGRLADPEQTRHFLRHHIQLHRERFGMHSQRLREV